jgi:transposase
VSPQVARMVERREQARKLAGEGRTREQIARELGVSVSTAYNLLREPAVVGA